MSTHEYKNFATITASKGNTKALLFRDHLEPAPRVWESGDKNPFDRRFLQENFVKSVQSTVLLIENVDQGWLVDLDALCDLDPRFLKNYVASGTTSKDFSDKNTTATGKWYVLGYRTDTVTANLECIKSQQWSQYRPWWGEDCRLDMYRGTLVSKIACYCVTPAARKSPRHERG